MRQCRKIIKGGLSDDFNLRYGTVAPFHPGASGAAFPISRSRHHGVGFRLTDHARRTNRTAARSKAAAIYIYKFHINTKLL